MKTYEQQIKELATPMVNNSIKIIADRDDSTYLGIVIKNDISVISKLRGVATITTPIYNCENKTLLINIAPANNAEMEKGITIPIELGDEFLEKILLNLCKGLGKIEVFYSSNDIKTVWATEILRDEISRCVLERELKHSGIIK